MTMHLSTAPLQPITALVYDYQLIIRPNEKVRRRLDAARSKAREQMLPFGNWHPGKNHIPVASFSQLASLESRLTSRLETLAKSLPPFRLQVQHFGAILHHTIFFRIAENAGFNQLLRLLHAEKAALTVFNQEPRIASMAKINVAYKLSAVDFENAWHAFKSKRFQVDFIADNMLLLRKRPGETHWQILTALHFENLPIDIQQGQLF